MCANIGIFIITEESKSIQEAQIIDLQSILQSSFILLGFGWVLNILTAVRYLQWSKEIASQGNGTVQVDWLSQIFFMTNIAFILFGYWFFAKGIVQIPIGKNDIQSKMLNPDFPDANHSFAIIGRRLTA